MLTHRQVRAVYDRLGSRLDWYRFTEAPGIEDLIAHGAFGEGTAVFELGCGTGRLAERLLGDLLPSAATYCAVDLSTTMVELARRRLARFGDRAEVRLTDGDPHVEAPDGAFDRFVTTYVLDLLSADDIRVVVAESYRVLKPGGRLCVTSLCRGCTPASRLVISLWQTVLRIRPSMLGGCRPLEPEDYVPGEQWTVLHAARIVRLGFPSAVVIAEKT